MIGFPLHVRLILHAGTTGWGRLPIVTPWRHRGALGLSLWNEHGVLLQERRAVRGFVREGASWSLAAGEAREMLVDVSDLLPDTLGAGVHHLVVDYGGPGVAVSASAARIEFRAPERAEQDWLDDAHVDLDAAGSWGQWTLAPPSPGETFRLPRESSDPLRFNQLVRSLIMGRTPLEAINPSVLSVLDGFYEIERALLELELQTLHDPVRATERAREWKQRVSALRSRIDESLAEQGGVRGLRDLLGPEPAEFA